jgi:hypothetical protein
MKNSTSFLFPYNLAGCLIIIFTVVFSCSKKGSPLIDRPTVSPSPFEANREYYWGNAWQKTIMGYEMIIPSSRLTDSVINKGIRVGLAIYSSWSVFQTLPVTLYDPVSLPDTINLSYTAIPGDLKVVAKTAVNITWPSDVFIQY